MSMSRPYKKLRLAAAPLRPAVICLPLRPLPSHRFLHTRPVQQGISKAKYQATLKGLSEFLGAPSKSVSPSQESTATATTASTTSAAAVPRETPSAPPSSIKTPLIDSIVKEGIDTKGNPILQDYLSKKSADTSTPIRPAAPAKGGLASSSIFGRIAAEDEEPIDQDKPATSTDTETAADGTVTKKVERNAEAMALVLDPNPLQRKRWERRMVIQEIRKRGRLTTAQLLLRTERAQLSKSKFWKTSVKKLGMLARQIQGKTLADALVQMRYSSKKAAADVAQHLEAARVEAIVRKGMALGNAAPMEPGQSSTAATPTATTTIELKNGEKHVVRDRTALYIDQAWVGRGPYGTDIDMRARGRSHRLRLPQTSLTVVLKEEATRIREHEERQEKSKRRKLWVALPDRPITGQRQYYSW